MRWCVTETLKDAAECDSAQTAIRAARILHE